MELEKRKIVYNIISYVFTLILLILVIRFFLTSKEIILIQKVGIFSVTISIMFALISYLLSGLQYSILVKQYGIKLEKKDIIFLPIVMPLWSFIFPIQGSGIFFTLFLTRKYKIKVVESLSTTIFLYLLVLFYGGIFGTIFCLYYKIFSLFTFISLFLLLIPLFIIITNMILILLPNLNNMYIHGIISFIKNLIKILALRFIDYKNSLIILFISIIQMIVNTFWCLWISTDLGYNNPTFVSLIVLVNWMQISLVIRFTPNNLGISQIISGALFSLMSIAPEQGIMISLISTVTCTIIALTLGVVFNFYYMRKLDIHMSQKALSQKVGE